MDLKLSSRFEPIDDQKRAIDQLAAGVEKKAPYQVLLGVTGSGKTFTVANLIAKLNRPTLIISHNKTLAAQLYQEFRDFFPQNAVSYFVSYYDYYQPEAYIPSTDTYIEKDSAVNELIDKLRLATTSNILTRKDVIVVASVSCIYNIGSPKDYGKSVLTLTQGEAASRDSIIDHLLSLQYERNDYGFNRGTFRVRGDGIDVYPAYQDNGVALEVADGIIKKITMIDPLTGAVTEGVTTYTLYPAKHFMTDQMGNKAIFEKIRTDMMERVTVLKDEGKLVEAQRLQQKVSYDLEMIEEVGYVKGIENYSMYFDGRSPGDAPFSLLDYFNEAYGDDWITVVDESHITFPQIRGMHAGDAARKKTLVDYGFRLPSAFDNRPLTFPEFQRRISTTVAVSATPASWELSMAEGKVVEQLVRPTGIPDPEVTIKPTANQVADCMEEVKKRAQKGERTLITTLTKRTAEDLTEYLKEQGLKVHYLHSDVHTLDRTDILDDLRSGTYDALVGINLLREGLDLPEVSLVAILDADKEGFLRSDVTLIQTMGRAARHVEGHVIMYADKVTGSMQRALDEVKRRREYQLAYNKEHNITPSPITKPIREKLVEREITEEPEWFMSEKAPSFSTLSERDISGMTPMDKKKLVRSLRAEMRIAANDLEFELAAQIRDTIRSLE